MFHFGTSRNSSYTNIRDALKNAVRNAAARLSARLSEHKRARIARSMKSILSEKKHSSRIVAHEDEVVSLGAGMERMNWQR